MLRKNYCLQNIWNISNCYIKTWHFMLNLLFYWPTTFMILIFCFYLILYFVATYIKWAYNAAKIAEKLSFWTFLRWMISAVVDFKSSQHNTTQNLQSLSLVVVCLSLYGRSQRHVHKHAFSCCCCCFRTFHFVSFLKFNS